MGLITAIMYRYDEERRLKVIAVRSGLGGQLGFPQVPACHSDSLRQSITRVFDLNGLDSLQVGDRYVIGAHSVKSDGLPEYLPTDTRRRQQLVEMSLADVVSSLDQSSRSLLALIPGYTEK